MASEPCDDAGGGDPDPDPGDPGDCDDDATLISAVQGAGPASPLVGQEVTIEGVVVGDFQGDPARPGYEEELGGFFVQEEPADQDGDPATSEGIFVFDPDAPALVEGDTVRIIGAVQERFGNTEIGGDTTVVDCELASVVIDPAPVELPVSVVDDLERFEGMLVTLAQVLTVTEVFGLGQFGEFDVSVDGRLFNPTNGQPGTGDNDESRLLVDDGRQGNNREPIPYLGSDGTLRIGDTTTGLTGILDFDFGRYRLQPTEAPAFAGTNPRTEGPDDVGGDVTVASFNVLNYFTTIDEPGLEEPPGGLRGADSDEEFERQETKIVEAIAAIDAAVVGLIEIENQPDPSATETLIDAMNQEMGPGTYDGVFDVGTEVGDDAIKVDLIYQPTLVTPVGAPVIYDDAAGAFANARLPLAQTFEHDGDEFTVIVNHFKSKGCGDGDTGDNADGPSGCFNGDRVRQAEALLDFADDFGDDVLITGDLNAYGEEDPITTLEAGGFTDLIDDRLAEDDQYSYVFFGESGYLDHALASGALVAKVTGVDIWHINADEPRLLDYNLEFNPPELFQPNPFRSSDHDPVIVGLDLGEEAHPC